LKKKNEKNYFIEKVFSDRKKYIYSGF